MSGTVQNIDFRTIVDRPILDISAKFWESARYNAFRALYMPFRIIDDMVDNRKEAGLDIPEAEKQQLASTVAAWAEAMPNGSSETCSQLGEVVERFGVPSWTWKRFSESMVYDIHHNGFKTFPVFLEYSEGAAIAPASIFMHICGLKGENGSYSAPKFDVRGAAKPAALFSYLVHIIRDFQKDHMKGLNYFPDDLMAKNSLNTSILSDIASGGKITQGFRNLMAKYREQAGYYRDEFRQVLGKIRPYLEPRYALSMEMIFSLYSQVFERIDVKNGSFTTEELNPTTKEIGERISETVSSFR